MCGIAGAVGRVDEAVLAALERSALAQRHRGPDSAGSWTGPGAPDARAAFAFRRLAIVDLSPAADQPMRDPRTGCVLVFNGEIYNHDELRAELAADGLHARTRADSEVVLLAWARWGRAMLERLRGMFAFALWDPHSRTVLLARDRLGIKPLYWTVVEREGARTLLFASELRSLLAGGLVERRLDPLGLGTYLWNGFVQGPATLVRGVELLPAGSFAIVSPPEPRVLPRRWWSLPKSREANGSSASNGASGVAAEPALARLGEVAEEAVRQHLASDVPLALFLSGGVDSSAVANLALRSGAHELASFHVGFDEAELDETRHARAVAEALGSRHVERRLGAEEFARELEHALAALDQPTFDALNTWYVSRAVREAGFTVALAGTGGDELFGGYASFKRLPLVVRASRLAGPLAASAPRLASLLDAPGEHGLGSQGGWGKLGEMLAARGALLETYQLSYALFRPELQRELFPALEQLELRCGLPAARADELERELADEPILAALSRLELASFLENRLLRDTDGASMAHSLEARVPLLDHALVEAACALPQRTRYLPHGAKQALRTVGLAGLDPRLFEREKQGFELPLERWTRARLAGEVEAVLRDEPAARAIGLEPAPLARLADAWLAGAPGLHWSRPWSLFVLLRWCAAHRLRL